MLPDHSIADRLLISASILILNATPVLAAVGAITSESAKPGSIVWESCPFEVNSRVRCGKINVPENREQDGGRQILLSFAVIDAAGATRAPDPVAFLTGGPGFSAFAFLKDLPEVAFNQRRDIVVLEPRGYGYSDPWLGCESVEEGWDYDWRCGSWPVDRVDPSINGPVANDMPTAVLVGSYDPVTPPEFGDGMLLHLSNATLVLDPSTSHILILDDNPCVHDIIVRFLDRPNEKLDVSCLMSTKPVEWDLPAKSSPK